MPQSPKRPHQQTDRFTPEEYEARKVPEYYLKYLKAQQSMTSVSVEEATVDVFPGVYPSGTDARLLGSNLKDYISKGRPRVLDVGSSAGTLAVLAGMYGAEGVAVDINPTAVRNMKHNFEAAGVNFTAIESDVFANVPPQKFDLILANPPHLDGEITEPLDYAIYGTSDFVDKLLKDAHRYLTKSGKIVISYAQWGPLKEFERKIKLYGWQSKIVDTMRSADSERHYNLYELWKVL